ncbi:hypothetical protein AMECASPLE_034069 [Ameca splendens]|uniref:Uncharacterized protein n=1 Tax=Ameca splendens TaxID=208324 RepID=A0ABV0ZFU4_9TELE
MIVTLNVRTQRRLFLPVREQSEAERLRGEEGHHATELCISPTNAQRRLHLRAKLPSTHFQAAAATREGCKFLTGGGEKQKSKGETEKRRLFSNFFQASSYLLDAPRVPI